MILAADELLSDTGIVNTQTGIYHTNWDIHHTN